MGSRGWRRRKQKRRVQPPRLLQIVPSERQRGRCSDAHLPKSSSGITDDAPERGPSVEAAIRSGAEECPPIMRGEVAG
jgi:hypothetical protein